LVILLILMEMGCGGFGFAGVGVGVMGGCRGWRREWVVDLGCAGLLIWAIDQVVEVVVDRLLGF
jgi:hypothetical protein